jgi:hypothetical protein
MNSKKSLGPAGTRVCRCAEGGASFRECRRKDQHIFKTTIGCMCVLRKIVAYSNRGWGTVHFPLFGPSLCPWFNLNPCGLKLKIYKEARLYSILCKENLFLTVVTHGQLK